MKPSIRFCGANVQNVYFVLTVGVSLVVIQWNTGAAVLGNVITSMRIITVRINTNAGFRTKTLQRITSANLKCKNSVRKQRQLLRQKRKRKHDSNPSYVSGGFSIHTEPDKIVSKKLKLSNHQEISIKFVNETF